MAAGRSGAGPVSFHRGSRGQSRWAKKGASHVATEDKAAGKATEVKGKVKEGLGKATGDEELEAEGQVDQAKGDLKQAAEKVKDAFKK